MDILFTREGGLFGQVLEKTLPATDLPADLQTLAQDTFAHPEPYHNLPTNPALRDGYHYTLVLKQGRKKVSLAFDDANRPESLRPLLSFLAEHAEN